MFKHYLESINQFLASHPYYGLFFALLVAFAESLPILGTLIPGSITMTFIGIVVGRNFMPLGMTLLSATIGALLGDIIGYMIGKHYKEQLHNIWPFRKYPKLLKLLTMGEAFFQKHGGKSIIIGRFIGPTRSSVPLIAGLMKMRWPNFMIAALPSAFLWALLYLVPGILIGSISLALPKEKATTFTLISLGCIIFLWLIFWGIQRFFVFMANFVNRYVDRTWNWLNQHHASQFLIRTLTNKNNPKDHHQLTLAFFALISGLFFIFIFSCVKFQYALYHLNEPVFYFLQSLRGHRSDVFFIVFTELGNKYTWLFSCIFICVILALRKNFYTLYHLLILMLFAFGSVWIMKHIFYSPRPTGFLEATPNSSFPSGHTTLTLCFLGFFAYLSAHSLEKPWRWIPFSTSGILVFCVALSRLYLGAHWLCDILGALSLSFTILWGILIAYRRKQPILQKPMLLVTTLSLAIALPWSIHFMKNYHKDLRHFTRYFPQQTANLHDWWRFPGIYLPIYRINRFGTPIQPFNIQWAGDLSTIQTLLKANGWLPIRSRENLQSALQRFAGKAPEQHLAILPQLYRQKPQALFMIKHIPKLNMLIELRLWDTGIHFEKNQQLFIGSMNFHKAARSLLGLGASQQITLAYGGGIKQLSQDIEQQYQMKTFSIQTNNLPKKTIRLEWDGLILMIKPK